MAKKTKSFRAENTGIYRTKSYRKPRWMRILRLISLIIVSILTLLAAIGMIIHVISHFK